MKEMKELIDMCQGTIGLSYGQDSQTSAGYNESPLNITKNFSASSKISGVANLEKSNSSKS